MSGDPARAVADGPVRPTRRRDTLVTAVYELDPDGPLGGRRRSIAYYFPSLASIAGLGAGLVVYTRPAHVERIERHLRSVGASAIVIGRDLEATPRFAEIQELRDRQGVRAKPWRDRCHVLCHAKLAWLADQGQANPFGSDRFYWIDAGLAYPGLFPSRYLPEYRADRCALFTPRVLAALRTAGESLVMIGLRPPMGAQVHNIPLEAHLAFSGTGDRPIDSHVIGGFFGGAARAVCRLYADYDLMLAAMLADDLLGTEENILTILYHRAPEQVSLLPFSTWYHEESGIRPPGPEDVSFYRIFETLATGVVPLSSRAAQT